MTPVSSIYQIRPNLEHIDQLGEKEKALKKRVEAEDDFDPFEVAEETKVVQLSLKKVDATSSMTQAEKQAAEEPWEVMDLYDAQV